MSVCMCIPCLNVSVFAWPHTAGTGSATTSAFARNQAANVREAVSVCVRECVCMAGMMCG